MLRSAKSLVLAGLRTAGYDLVKRPEPQQMGSDALEIAPVSDVPYVRFDPSVDNPVPQILASPDYLRGADFFGHTPSAARALVSSEFQSLLYTLICNMKPDLVVEIGSFYASTSEAICRGLQKTRKGMLYTVDPYGADRVPSIVQQWPVELQEHVTFLPINSMALYQQLALEQLKADIIFIDGNHDYEFALFDVNAGAARIAPGGFLFVDNVSQSGPYLAVKDFVALHQDWTDCGGTDFRTTVTKAFDKERSGFPVMDCAILRAPRTIRISDRPWTSGNIPWDCPCVHGLRLRFASPPCTGTLYVEIVLRGFKKDDAVEEVVSTAAAIEGDSFEKNFDIKAEHMIAECDSYYVEPWLIWHGRMPVDLIEPPAVY